MASTSSPAPSASRGRRTWAIRYFPNGDRPETADHVSLYLVLKDPVADHFMVKVGFSFIDEVEKQTPSYVRTIAASKFLADGSWGRKEFVRREDLERSGRLRDDCFTVRCDMVVAVEIRTEATSSFVMVPPTDWPQHFGDLLLVGQGADVWFLVGGEAFTAHRCVLAARSPVFSAQLFGRRDERRHGHRRNFKRHTNWVANTEISPATEDCIRIDDMMPQVLKSSLHFIYMDSLPETEGQDDEGVTMAQHLLEAADRYDMQRLKLLCEDRLCHHIDVSTVASTLALAEQHRCKGLRREHYQKAPKSPKTLYVVMATDGFQHLVKSCPSALFDLMSKLAAR
ncbi:BTB/POZ and MATH domain-containing protein 1-like [Phragmites australis]|uniref:BTB/POZ and MATH domain-containing protein 1-like n=1 Tax=Phragmites australis TaxID=29695 RepID=UPI002D783B06|nr:BTB/POZ and MATH domain-containing protein 1-like [Phragmites australis]